MVWRKIRERIASTREEEGVALVFFKGWSENVLQVR